MARLDSYFAKYVYHITTLRDLVNLDTDDLTSYSTLQCAATRLYQAGAGEPFCEWMAIHALQMGAEDGNRSNINKYVRDADLVKGCALEWISAAPFELYTLNLGVQCITAAHEKLRQGGPYRNPACLVDDGLMEDIQPSHTSNYQDFLVFAENRYTTWMRFVKSMTGGLKELSDRAKSQIGRVDGSWKKVQDALTRLNSPWSKDEKVPML